MGQRIRTDNHHYVGQQLVIWDASGYYNRFFPIDENGDTIIPDGLPIPDGFKFIENVTEDDITENLVTEKAKQVDADKKAAKKAEKEKKDKEEKPAPAKNVKEVKAPPPDTTKEVLKDAPESNNLKEGDK